ncbi:MAG: methyltransferase [Glaciihabitans sp.]|jgi:adenine-specific DNA-methyltransferase|nr:methyltransferase [Glaciihabitans sp.]
MAKTLLEELPEIVRAGRRQAQQILEQLEGPGRVSLQTRELVIPSRDFSGFDIYGVDSHSVEISHGLNRLIYGDNMLAMAALLAGGDETPSMRGKIDLIYIDPPFDSKADYRTQILLPGKTIDQRPTVAEQFAYSDTWANGTASYLEMMTPRLHLMRELLSATGTICVHLDWHVGHYVKILLDEVFGKDRFVNEVVWRYGKMSNALRKFPQNHDVLLVYSKSDRYYFAPVKTADSEYKARFQRVVDNNRVTYGAVKDSTDKLILLRVRKVQKELGRDLQDDDVLFDFDVEFKTQDDVFYDISIVKGNAKENLAFETQKPEKLLERIITALTPEGATVADFYAGSGTTVAVAERLSRKWLTTELAKPATMITRKRLVDQNAAPFLYQAIGDYQVEQARSTLGRKFKIGELSQTVLSIYGALPLPAEENVNGSLGYLPNEHTLVIVDSPSRLTTVSTLRRAQAYRDSKMGGFRRVLVLGWNFSASIGHDLAALNDPDGLDVRVIPPDLLDRLKKRGKENLIGEVRFATLQYLEAHVETAVIGDALELEVVLDNYVLLSPDAISLNDEDRATVLSVMNREPLALIEYWAIDPDFDDYIFRSSWQDYRGNTANDGDALRTVTHARITVPPRETPRQVCVRAIDVFGFESEVIVTVAGTDA